MVFRRSSLCLLNLSYDAMQQAYFEVIDELFQTRAEAIAQNYAIHHDSHNISSYPNFFFNFSVIFESTGDDPSSS